MKLSQYNSPTDVFALPRCAAGAGVGVGSGVGMMVMQMAEEEQKQKGAAAVAHSPVEKKVNLSGARGFAASAK